MGDHEEKGMNNPQLHKVSNKHECREATDEDVDAP